MTHYLIDVVFGFEVGYRVGQARGLRTLLVSNSDSHLGDDEDVHAICRP